MRKGGMKVAGPYASPSVKASAAGAAPSGILLPHLAGPAAALRQVLAAHAVRTCAHVIEIGGAGLPITGFLTHRPETVTVIDPKIPEFSAAMLNGAPCRLRHHAAKLQEVEIAPQGPYALVLLGLSLKPFGRRGATPPELLALAAGANVLVIDYALDLERAQGQIGALSGTRAAPPTIDLALTINDETLRAAGFDRRRFLVFVVSKYSVTSRRTGVATVTSGGGGSTYALGWPQPANPAIARATAAAFEAGPRPRIGPFDSIQPIRPPSRELTARSIELTDR